MHKLDRTLAEYPQCLDDYQYPRNKWDDLCSTCRSQIHEALTSIQGKRCAYCEGPLFDGAHIEHFRRKNPAHFPHLTFEWTNLFWSCESQDHCGHYKDRPSADPYSPDDLIKPDEDDPHEYLYFHSSGEVRAKGHITEERVSKALETIRVFCLDHPTLTAERRNAVKRYLRSSQGNVDAILEFAPPDREDFIQEELEAVVEQPYASTLRHFLERPF